MKAFKILAISVVAIFMIAAFSFGNCGNCDSKAKTGEAVKLEKGNQTVCPIMGNKINKKSYVDYNGKRVFFCCDGCEKKFLADADNIMKKGAEKGIKYADAPITQEFCPCGGKKINSKIHSDSKGKRTYFCSEGCKKGFEKKHLNRKI